MIFFRKSILNRVFVYFLLFGVLLTVGTFTLYSAKWQSVSLWIFISSLFIFLLYFILVYLYEIVRPLQLILNEMRALLAGKKYRRIYTSRIDEIGIIAHFFNEVTRSFEKVSLDIKEGKRMLNELEIASQIQKAILPPQNPKVPGLDVDAKTRPAAELGGDNFDFLTVGNNTFIYVGDVTGHGVPAAIVMTMVNTLVHTLVNVYDNAYDIVVQTNKQLKTRIKSTMFMTMLMFRWNHMEQKLTFVGAGHEHLVIYRAKSGKCEVRPTGGIALGMVADNSRLVKEVAVPLEVDDVVIMYSDGLTEGRNMAGEMYGLERLVAAVERFAPQYSSDGIVHHVSLDYSRFVENHKQDDDVTLIAMKHVGIGQEGNSSIAGIDTATMAWVGQAPEVKAAIPTVESPLA